MSNEIDLYKQMKIDKYSKLRNYDYNEFNGKSFQAIKACFTSKDFKNIRFKNGNYNQCKFEHCTFNSVGLSGTHFLSCELIDFEIKNSNLQFCDFSSNSLLIGDRKKSLIAGCNMSQSMFNDVTLQNITIKNATISQARFIKTQFRDVAWESCTLQDNVFDNITMTYCSLIGCNLEYSDFKNIIFNEVELPFHQLPYTFGLLKQLSNFSDQILIGAVSSDCDPLHVDEYISLLPELFSYYKEINEYFPAINIALFLEEYDQANSLIDAGIQYYIHINDFRKIKGICKLIADNPYYDRHFMTQLYFKLVDYYNLINVTEYEQYQYSLHINDIKRTLTQFDNTMPIAQLYLKTDITTDDIEKLGVFYKLIEDCMENCALSTEDYSVEIRHNSAPLSLWLTLAQFNPQLLIKAIGMLMSIITANPSFLQEALNVAGNMATIGAFALQISTAMNSNKKSATLSYPDVADKDIIYINEKSQVLKKKNISVSVSLPFFNFNYQKENIRRK